MDTARCLLSEAIIKTPYEILTGKKPNIKNPRICGSRIFLRVPEEKRKWEKGRLRDIIRI